MQKGLPSDAEWQAFEFLDEASLDLDEDIVSFNF
jgi:hypothetical protein